MCLGCGYQGRELRAGAELSTFLCPRCGEDWYARPPRSYAELEGLGPVSVDLPPAVATRRLDATRLRAFEQRRRRATAVIRGAAVFFLALGLAALVGTAVIATTN
ncbi:MAG: hypothetical protein IBJ11_00680 [Phycisphaerales bacterium]|nr:hypothetical protein [Phycisphaerales bacterium]